MYFSMHGNLLDMLSSFRKKAIRCRVWFEQKLHDRVLTDMLIKNVKIVKSKILAITISRLIVKLFNATKYAFTKKIESIGRSIVSNVVPSASSMGWDAKGWLDDPFIIRWYGLQAYYSPMYSKR